MILRPNDLKDELNERLKRRQNVVRVNGYVIEIDIGAVNLYEIPLSEISSERRILEWVSHLSVKNGVDLATIEVFIEKALAHVDRLKRE